MKNGLIIMGIFVVFFCKAQQILPLNTSALDAPVGSYFKDLNNELDYYTGIWTSNFENKTIKLVITKEVKIPFKMWKKNWTSIIKNVNGKDLYRWIRKIEYY